MQTFIKDQNAQIWRIGNRRVNTRRNHLFFNLTHQIQVPNFIAENSQNRKLLKSYLPRMKRTITDHLHSYSLTFHRQFVLFLKE